MDSNEVKSDVGVIEDVEPVSVEPVELPEKVSIRGDDYMSVLRQVVAIAEELGNCVFELSVKTKPESVGRNDRCPCKSGKKYKVCCLRFGSRPPVYKIIPRELYAEVTELAIDPTDVVEELETVEA